MRSGKVISAATAVAIIASLTGCGANSRTGGTADGMDIPAGVYIYYLQSAYYDAQSKIREIDEENAPSTGEGEEGQEAVTTAETTAKQFYARDLEGKTVKDWMVEQATKDIREYAAIEKKFSDYSLSLSAEDLSSASNYCEQMWGYGGEFLSGLGISYDSYLAIYLNDQKRSQLFKTLYSEGGEQAVPDSEIKNYMLTKYARMDYIDFELKDGEGNLLKSDGKAEIKAMAEDYIQRYNNGEDFTALALEYHIYHEGIVAEAEAKAALTAPAETEAPIDNEGLDFEVIPENAAEADSPAEEESGTIEETTETAETAAEDEALTDDSEDVPAETEAPVTEETTVTTTTAAPEETTETTAETTAAPTTEELLAQHPDFQSNDHAVEKGDKSPSEAVVNAVFDEMKVGDIRLFESEDGEHLYLVVKNDIEKDDSYFQTAKESLLFEMKEGDYDTLIDSWVNAQNYQPNNASIKRYDPEKMFTQS